MKALNGYATYTDSDGVKRYKGPGPPPFTFAGLEVIVSPYVCERRQYRFMDTPFMRYLYREPIKPGPTQWPIYEEQ